MTRTEEMGQAYHPVPQNAVVVPQKPPALQHCLLKSPPAQVKPPLLAPQVPSTEGIFVVRQALEALFWLFFVRDSAWSQSNFAERKMRKGKGWAYHP